VHTYIAPHAQKKKEKKTLASEACPSERLWLWLWLEAKEKKRKEEEKKMKKEEGMRCN